MTDLVATIFAVVVLAAFVIFGFLGVVSLPLISWLGGWGPDHTLRCFVLGAGVSFAFWYAVCGDDGR